VLKKSFQGFLTTNFVRKLLNVRSPQTPKFNEITALVPFSTPTPDFTQNVPEKANRRRKLVQSLFSTTTNLKPHQMRLKMPLHGTLEAGTST